MMKYLIVRLNEKNVLNLKLMMKKGEVMTREMIFERIMNVARAHHDDVSKQDEDNAMECAEEIYVEFRDLREKCLELQRGKA